MTGITVDKIIFIIIFFVLLTYLSIRDSSISVFIDLFYELVDFLVTYIEPSGLNESSEFFFTYCTIIV